MTVRNSSPCVTLIRSWVLLWFLSPLLFASPPPPSISNNNIYTALHHFEVLHRDEITHHSLPSHLTPSHLTPSHLTPSHLTPTQMGMKHIHFRTLNRDFNLILAPSRTSVHVSVVTGGRAERRPLPYPHLYTGHLLGEDDSRVISHFDPDTSVLTATIRSGRDYFYIEPSSRHIKESHDCHMIAYHQSHVKFNLTGHSSKHFCGNSEHTRPTISEYGQQTSPRQQSSPQQQQSSPQQHLSPRQQSLPWQQKSPQQRVDPFPWQQPSLAGSLPRDGPSSRQLVKRGLSGDVCTVHAVVTPSFHEQYSSGDPDTTTLYVLQMLRDIDENVFGGTQFESPYSRLGLIATNITIYTDYTATNPPYAQDREKDSEKLLQLFSYHDWTHVCLAHLFTATPFRDHRLGVAYVASRDRHDTGGICSPYVARNGADETANVAVSSYRNVGNKRLLLAEARLVTAHELGHGWGSEHDPVSGNGCNPPLGREQGKFLMFPSATDGDQKNNDRFSPCSVTMISDVVRKKGTCFKERSQLVGLCGNYRVEKEEGEECDAGALGMVGRDSCCTEDCKLRNLTSSGERVQCSDVNNACCENCHIIASGSAHVCMRHESGNRQCLENVLCSGDKDCPMKRNHVEPWTICGKDGRCLPADSKCDILGNCTVGSEVALQCLGFCRWHNLEECFCGGDDECRFCCLQSSPEYGNMTCRPYMGNIRPDRSSCVGGFCEKGKCIPAAQDLIQRLFNLFDNPNINTFVQFMQENIVLTVIFLTLVLWIPIGYIIHLIDLYRWREHKKVSLEFEKQLQEAELEDEEDLHIYDSVFEQMEHLHPGVLRFEAKTGLMRLHSISSDCFGEDTDLHIPLSPSSPLSPNLVGGMGAWDNRLSTITEESHQLNPERDNILRYMTPPRSSFEGANLTPQRAFGKLFQ